MGSLHSAAARSVEFIAWGNFADPGVLALWLKSFTVLAALFIVAWAAGQLACRALTFRSAEEQFVVVGTTGLGAVALAASVLALAGLYRWWAGALLAGALLVAARRWLTMLPHVLWSVVRSSPWTAAFAVLCSLRALLPPYRWDEVSYHLAYPQQWVATGHLTIDPHLPYPLYTLTWQALLGVTLMLGSPEVAHLLSWLTGVLAAWCIGLFLQRLGASEPTIRVARVAFLATPLVLSVLDVAMVDVPIMCFMIVSLYALVSLHDVPAIEPRHIVAAALCGGVLVGLKLTNILYLPLLLGAAANRLPRRALISYALAMGAAGSLWYLRNLLITGDPLTPLLANAVGHAAPYWSRADLAAQTADLKRGLSYSPLALLALPVRVVLSSEGGPLRGAPVLGYALLLPVSLLMIRQFWRDRAMYVLVATWYVAVVWVGTTYLLRYAYWIPLAIVLAGVIVERVVRLWVKSPRWWPWLVSAALLIGPTWSAIPYLKNAFHDRIPVGESARRAYAFGGVADTAAFGAVIRVRRPGARVYNVSPPLTYYWQAASVSVVNGAFHPGGLMDFDAALRQGRVHDFLDAVQADYLVLDDRYAATLFRSPRDSISAKVRRALGTPLYNDSAQSVYSFDEGRLP